MLLRCVVGGASGGLEVVGGTSGTTTKHLAAAATTAVVISAAGFAAQRHPAAEAAAAIAAVLAPSLPASHIRGHNLAAVALAHQASTGYLLHPAALDACIHLAPVPAAGASIAVTRVPVAAACLTLPAAAAQTALSGWAGAESVGIAADQSAKSNMRWRGESPAGASMLLCGLAARPIPRGGSASQAAPAPAGLTYSVEWQVVQGASVADDQSAAAGVTPQLDVAGWTAARRHPQRSGGAPLAASFLALVQQVRHARKCSGQWLGFSWTHSFAAGLCPSASRLSSLFAHGSAH